MGNSQSAPNPRHKRTDSSMFSHKHSDKKLRKLSKPKVGGETPNPIQLPVSLSRRNSRTSVREYLPDPPLERHNSVSGSIVYSPPPQQQLARSGSVAGSIDLGRRNSLTGPGWNNHPSQKPSRETLHSPTPVAMGRQRSGTLDSVSPPTNPLSPGFARPMTANTLDNLDLAVHQLPLELEDPPPPTASSTASFHSALQSPTSPTKRLTPSPTKFINGFHQSQNQSPQSSPQQVAYIPDSQSQSFQIPVRRRSLLQAAAPGMATRPRAVELEAKPSDEYAVGDDDTLFMPASRLLSIDSPEVRPETPQEQSALGIFRKGSLYIANGAPSPAPSSPSLRATSGGSQQRPRDSSLLSLPPTMPPVDTSYAVADKPQEPDTASSETPTQKKSFKIPRKAVGSAESSPASAKKPAIQIDTTSPPPQLGLRLVPPSPENDDPDVVDTSNIEPRSADLDDESDGEDPHRRHLFGYSLRNKQFMNGQYQPSPTSDYSQGTASAEPSARPGFKRSPFSYEGAKLAQVPNPIATDLHIAKRPHTAVDPKTQPIENDTPVQETVKPKPSIKRKSVPNHRVELPSEPATLEPPTQGDRPSMPEDQSVATSMGSDISDQSVAKQSGADSGYSSAGSSVLPPSDYARRAKNRQSAPEQLANDFNRTYPENRPATSHNAKEGNAFTSIPTVPYSSVRNRTPPAIDAPRTPKSKKSRQPFSLSSVKKTPKAENEVAEADEAAEKKTKKKRRLSFKRLSFKSDKKPTVQAPEVDKKEDEAIVIDDDAPTSSPGFMPPMTLGDYSQPEETQYQLQPQPERRQSLTSSIRSGLQSIGYAPEAVALGTPEDEPPSPFEPIAITSSLSSRGVQAVRSSESVTYTGATYYQRFSTPSPGPGTILNMAPMTPQKDLLDRNPSFMKHTTTPPSSYRPPNRYSMDDASRLAQQQQQQQQQIRRRPLGNTSIKTQQSPPNGYPNDPTRVSRNNSFTGSYTYNPQNGLYQPAQYSNSGSARSRYGNFSQPQSPVHHGNFSQPQSPVHNGVLPFATGQPPSNEIRRRSSSGSVGPSGYSHNNRDYTTDQAIFGLDFTDIPVRRANDLLQSYGSNGASAGIYGAEKYGLQSHDVSQAFYAFHNTEVYNDEDDEGFKKKKESFWKRASIVGRGRSKSQVREKERREIVGY